MHNCSYDRYDITPTLILEKVKVQNSAFPCSALTLLDYHSSLKYINRHEIPEFDSLHWHPHKNQFQHMEYICTLTKIINVIFPFLSKRFLSFLKINSYP